MFIILKNQQEYTHQLFVPESGYPPEIGLGDDGGVRQVGQHGVLRRHGQHAHHLRHQQQGQQRGRQNGSRDFGL